MKFTKDFSEYEPWSGAVDTYEKIVEADKLEELETLLEEHFGETIPDEAEINDLLWFEDEWVLKMLGIEKDLEE